MGHTDGGQDGMCLPFHKLLTAVALVICAGGILIGAGEGGNPCHGKKKEGAPVEAFCPTKELDYCCPGHCGASSSACVQISISVLTLAGIVCMIVAIFMLLMIPILCFLNRRKTLSVEDLDKHPQKIDKFRRASLEARRASLNSEKLNAFKAENPTQEPGARRGSKIAIQNQEVVMNPVGQGV